MLPALARSPFNWPLVSQHVRPYPLSLQLASFTTTPKGRFAAVRLEKTAYCGTDSIGQHRLATMSQNGPPAGLCERFRWGGLPPTVYRPSLDPAQPSTRRGPGQPSTSLQVDPARAWCSSDLCRRGGRRWGERENPANNSPLTVAFLGDTYQLSVSRRYAQFPRRGAGGRMFCNITKGEWKWHKNAAINHA